MKDTKSKTTKNNANDNKISKFLNKRNIALTSITSAIAAAPIGVCISNMVGYEKLLFDNKTFSSTDSIINYVKKNSTKNKVEGYNSTWSITHNGKTQTFKNSDELRKTVFDKYISTKTVKTNVDLKNFANEHGILGTVNNNYTSHIYDANAETKKVYQGLNDSVHLESSSAYKSYFDNSFRSALYFNNIYFENEDHLKNYLVKDYLPSQKQNQNNTIIINGPNGLKSSPINLDDTDAFKQVINFIESNALKTLRYTNSGNGTKIDITKDNFDSRQIQDSVRLDDLDYIHMHSNEGESTYVIDNVDSQNLIGPYFYEGTLDIGSFTNEKMWKKVNGINNKVYAESKVDSMIGSFFSSIINDDNVLNLYEAKEKGIDPLLFRTLLPSSVEGLSYDQWFLQELGKLSPQLKREVVKVNANLMQGKKYNTFYKIPILYSFLMQRIVSWGLSQEVLNLVLDYFVNICNFIQDSIELIALNDNLLLGGFDTKTFFNIGNGEYDLNTSTLYFLNKIKKQFPNLVALMSTYIGAQNNIIMASGLIPFKSLDNLYLVEYGIFNSERDYYLIEENLKPVYEIFSALDYKEMLSEYVNNSKRNDISIFKGKPYEEQKTGFEKINTTRTKISMNTMLSGLGAKNSQQFALADSILRLEIKMYLETKSIVNGGYLSKLYSDDLSYDMVGPFINLVAKNPEINAYQTYLALVIDKRMSTGIFNKENIKNPYEFGKNLARLIYSALGTAYLTGTSISRVHNHYRNSSVPNRTPTASSSRHDSISSQGSLGSSSWSDDWDSFSSSDWSVESRRPSWTSNRGEDVSAVPNPSESPVLDLFYSPNSSGESHASSMRNGNFNDVPGRMFSSRFAEEKGWVKCVDVNVDPDLLNPIFNTNKPMPSLDPRMTLSDAEDLLQWSLGSLEPGNSRPVSVASRGEAISRVNSISGFDSVRSNGVSAVIDPFDDTFSRISQRFDQIDSLINEWEIEVTGSTGTGGSGSVNSSRPTEDTIRNDKKKSWWSGSERFIKVKKGLSRVVDFASTIFSTAVTGLEIFFFVYDLLQTTKIQDYYVYTTADGTNFYWDGGLTITKYMGLHIEQPYGIEGMQLIEPIQVTLPQVEEFYYFNQNRYYDANELKREQLKYMINGGNIARTSNFAINYTLLPLKDNYVKDATTINELVNVILEDAHLEKNENGSLKVKAGSNEVNKNSIYLSNVSYIVNGNINGNDVSAMADAIKTSIRKTSIAVLPDLNNGVSNGQMTTNFLRPNGKFIYPGNYYDGDKVVKQDSSQFNNYIVDNSANMLKESKKSFDSNKLPTNDDYVITDRNKAANDSKDKLFDQYQKSFILNHKNVLKNETLKQNFNSILGDAQTSIIYVVKQKNGKVIEFVDSQSAMNYLLQNMKFDKNTDYQENVTYTFKGIRFSSEKEIRQWVDLNKRVLN